MKTDTLQNLHSSTAGLRTRACLETRSRALFGGELRRLALVSAPSCALSRAAVLFALALLTASALGAQTSIPIAGTAPDGYMHVYRCDVDFGTSGAPVDVTLSLYTTEGIEIRFGDSDAYAADPTDWDHSPYVIEAEESGNDTLTVTLAGLVHTGVHPILFTIEGWVDDGDYNGTLSVSSGSVWMVSQQTYPANLVGFRTHAGFGPAFQHSWITVNPGNDYVAEVDIDYGPNSQAVTFHLDVSSFDISGLIITDVTGGGSIPVAGFDADTSGGVNISQLVTTPAASGVRTLRFHASVSGPFPNTYWLAVLPSTAPAVDGRDLTGGSPTGGGGGSGGSAGGGSCAAAAGLGFAPWIIAALPAAAAILRRRRRS